MTNLTHEKFLSEFPEIKGLEVRLVVKSGESKALSVQAIDDCLTEMEEVDTQGGPAYELGSALINAAIKRYQLEGHEFGEGDDMNAFFDIENEEGEIKARLSSNYVEFANVEAVKTSFLPSAAGINEEHLKGELFVLTDEDKAALQALSEPLVFNLAFSGMGDEGEVDKCECLSAGIQDSLVLKALSDRMINALVDSDVVREVAGPFYSSDAGGYGSLFFNLDAKEGIQWDEAKSTLFSRNEAKNMGKGFSDSAMVGMEFSIKGDEIMLIKDPEDALSAESGKTPSLSQ